MFDKNKKGTKIWVALVVVAILVVITLLLQAQILSILSEMQAFILKTNYVMDANPLPALPTNYVMDSNPFPIGKF